MIYAGNVCSSISLRQLPSLPNLFLYLTLFLAIQRNQTWKLLHKETSKFVKSTSHSTTFHLYPYISVFLVLFHATRSIPVSLHLFLYFPLSHSNWDITQQKGNLSSADLSNSWFIQRRSSTVTCAFPSSFICFSTFHLSQSPADYFHPPFVYLLLSLLQSNTTQPRNYSMKRKFWLWELIEIMAHSTMFFYLHPYIPPSLICSNTFSFHCPLLLSVSVLSRLFLTIQPDLIITQ